MVLNKNYLANPNDGNSHKGYLHRTCIFQQLFPIPKNVDCRVLLVHQRGVVVAKLVELSLPTPEICGSNPDISKKKIYQLYNRKDKNKDKEAGKGPSLIERYSSKFFSEKGGIVNLKKQVWRF